MKPLELVIITGMSGAGKTVAMQSFEDMGYYTVDNLPPSLLPTFMQLIQESGQVNRVALVIDLRSYDFFEEIEKELTQLSRNANLFVRILFLDAQDQELVSRYKESRRSHPLAVGGRLIDGIQLEREKLKAIKHRANDYFNTSNLTPRQFREKLIKKYKDDESLASFYINVLSFGFKHGMPLDADIVMDVRFLPNPHYVEELREKTGLDSEVYNYVMQQPETEEFYKRFSRLLEYIVPGYKREGRSNLTIAIGCTGGQHRSVALAERVSGKLGVDGYQVNVSHRDINRRKESTVRS
ncbi:RNase adapter RapZ [Allofustis seminis]|uniref:RNase adapter RapZ n=1 Tax=Allofustis seminis TaxID=166939 RepID=UPI0003614B98|nr:RNase adapter RapZ [Allofustis seminis]